MKSAIGIMILLTFILLKISSIAKCLPMGDPWLQGDSDSYENEDFDDDDFFEEEDYDEGKQVYADYTVRKERKHDQKDVWKINMNHTKDKGMFESDIRLSTIQQLRVEVGKLFRIKRAARSKEPEYLWQHNTIYYKIDSGFSRSTKLEIKRGIRHWKRTMRNCLKFIRLDKDSKFEKRISREKFGGGPVHHILFTKTNSGCWSQVGRTDTTMDGFRYVPGQQLISIGDGCGEKGTVIHEIGHAVGFWHEQSRRDRDSYIRIVKPNIIIGQKGQFKRITNDQINSMGYAYDFWSVMHYGPTFFSRNGRPTIKILKPYRHLKPDMGQRNHLSYLDVAQVRAMYKCNLIPSLESKRTCIKKSTKGRDYRGKLDYTEKGVMCQPWYKQYPHSHKYDLKNPEDGLGRHNYCRNPGGEKERPWCFTTLSGQDTWQYCDLKKECET